MSERPDWERMLAYIHRRLREHPQLQGLEGLVYASGHTAAVCATYRHGTTELEARIERPRWWEPLKRSHGAALVERLAAELRAKHDALPQRGADGWLPMPALSVELDPYTRLSTGTVNAPGGTLAREGVERVFGVGEALEQGWARKIG